MDFLSLVLVAVGLSMDAFAVALCKGLCMKKINYRHTVIIAAFFGVFQAVMPLVGWLLGSQFSRYITSFDHWIVFVLLSILGGKMIKEALEPEEEVVCTVKLDIKELLGLAIATSIDALAVGISFAFLEVKILPSVSLIGVITFLLSFLGVALGNRFGLRFKKKAELAGGIILILIGLRILLEHLLV